MAIPIASMFGLKSVASRHGLGHLRHRAAGERGQQFVELALILPLLALLLVTAIDLGRAFHTYIALANAAREAARYSALSIATGNGPATSAQITTELGGNIGGCISGTIVFNGVGNGRGNTHTVTVSCKVQLVTPLLGGLIGADGNNRITINSTATFVIE